MRKTANLRAVAAALLERPDAQHWGYELSKQSGVRPGSMYPMLSRFLDAGWVTDGWETVGGKRPPRRYYELTELGKTELREVFR